MNIATKRGKLRVRRIAGAYLLKQSVHAAIKLMIISILFSGLLLFVSPVQAQSNTKNQQTERSFNPFSVYNRSGQVSAKTLYVPEAVRERNAKKLLQDQARPAGSEDRPVGMTTISASDPQNTGRVIRPHHMTKSGDLFQNLALALSEMTGGFSSEPDHQNNTAADRIMALFEGGPHLGVPALQKTQSQSHSETISMQRSILERQSADYERGAEKVLSKRRSIPGLEPQIYGLNRNDQDNAAQKSQDRVSRSVPLSKPLLKPLSNPVSETPSQRAEAFPAVNTARQDEAVQSEAGRNRSGQNLSRQNAEDSLPQSQRLSVDQASTDLQDQIRNAFAMMGRDLPAQDLSDRLAVRSKALSLNNQNNQPSGLRTQIAGEEQFPIGMKTMTFNKSIDDVKNVPDHVQDQNSVAEQNPIEPVAPNPQSIESKPKTQSQRINMIHKMLMDRQLGQIRSLQNLQNGDAQSADQAESPESKTESKTGSKIDRPNKPARPDRPTVSTTR